MRIGHTYSPAGIVYSNECTHFDWQSRHITSALERMSDSSDRENMPPAPAAEVSLRMITGVIYVFTGGQSGRDIPTRQGSVTLYVFRQLLKRTRRSHFLASAATAREHNTYWDVRSRAEGITKVVLLIKTFVSAVSHACRTAHSNNSERRWW